MATLVISHHCIATIIPSTVHPHLLLLLQGVQEEGELVIPEPEEEFPIRLHYLFLEWHTSCRHLQATSQVCGWKRTLDHLWLCEENVVCQNLPHNFFFCPLEMVAEFLVNIYSL